MTDVTVLPKLGAGEAVTAIAVPTVAVELLAGAVREIEVAALAVTETALEVTVALLESITLAVMLKLPAAVGTQVTEYGAVVSVPTIVVPTRNCTWAMVAPAPAVAVAVSETLEPTVTTAPAAGAETETVGAAGAPTVTTTAEEVDVAPFESVIRAVSEVEPTVLGVQSNEYGAVVAVPTNVDPAKNSTFVTVAGETTVVLAVSVTADPEVTVVPAVGAESATLGPVTFTLTMVDVDVAPFVSVARADNAKIPVLVGVQLNELAGGSAVPTTVVPARKSIRLTVAPPLPVADATRFTDVPSATAVPFVGLVIDTVGTAAATVTVAADEVTELPFESVTRAVRENEPVDVGVHESVYCPLDKVPLPITVAPERNWTCVTVAPVGAVAVAVSVVAVLTETDELALIETVGSATETVTLTAVELTTTLAESVTRAVMTEVPTIEGVQENV